MSLAVILDMDGVILDTEPISLGAWRFAAKECGYVLDDNLYERMVGLGAAANNQMLQQHFGSEFPVSRVAALAQACYRGRIEIEGVPLKRGVREFIRFLDDRAVPRAIATSTATDLAIELLRKAGVADDFEIVVGGDQVVNGKPAADIFLAAAAALNHPPADCIALEDSDPGVRAAAAAGMRPILIPDGRPPADETRRHAHAVVESLLQAIGTIEALLAASPINNRQ